MGLGAAAFQVACSADKTTAPTGPEKPSLAIAVGGGDAQTGAVGSALTKPIVVQVTGVTFPDAQITNFVVTSGGGSVFAPVVAKAGPQTVEARLVDPLTGTTLTQATFHATATAGAAAVLKVWAGDQQSAVAGSPVAIAPAALVTDQYGNPVTGVPVVFAASPGSGSITGPATVNSGATGTAAVGGWTLGSTAGPNTLIATSTGLTGSQLTFSAVATTGSAAQLVLLSGNNQSASTDSPLPNQPTVRVIDGNGNGVPNVAVTFTITSGGGSIDGVGSVTTLTTNGSSGLPVGSAAVNWTLGFAGRTNTLQATAVGLSGSPLVFTATGSKSLYVANQANNSITVYVASANGNATPTNTIAGFSTGLSQPQGIARDRAGNIYVTNPNPFTGSGSITVYAPGASGNATPTATIVGGNTRLAGPTGIALDGAGNIYVTNLFGGGSGSGAGNGSITVYAPGASGNATPTATIAGGSTGLVGPAGIALDGAGNIYVANQFVNSITVYAAGASGNATPMATIGSLSRALDHPVGIALDGAGNIYVTNLSFGGITSSITVYAAGAFGNATPTATIMGGPNTGLSNAGGIAVDGAGNIYVANNTISGGSITVYAPGASGDATPTATIAGGNTGLSDPFFITF